MSPWDALGIFGEIINREVTVVTLKDERVWNRAALNGNPMLILESIMGMWTGHQESLKKGYRLAETFKGKRESLLRGESPRNLTVPYKHGPAWLTWDASAGRFVLNEERAVIIREVFAKADAGWSIE